jgi:hypothetical protein
LVDAVGVKNRDLPDLMHPHGHRHLFECARRALCRIKYLLSSTPQSRVQHKETQDVSTLLGALLAGGATVFDRLLSNPYEEVRRTTRA